MLSQVWDIGMQDAASITYRAHTPQMLDYPCLSLSDKDMVAKGERPGGGEELVG